MNEHTHEISREVELDESWFAEPTGAPDVQPNAGPLPHPLALQSRPLRQFVSVRDKEKALNAYLAEQARQYIARNPKEFEGLAVTPKSTIRPKSVPGAGQVLRAILDRILSPTGAYETQTAIRAAIHAQFPDHAIVKDWTRPLPQWARIHVEQRIRNCGAAFASIKIKKSTSLSDLHASARCAMALSEDETAASTVMLTLSNDYVSINGKQFSISNNKSGGKVYRVVRINVDHLQDALSNR